MKVLAVDLGATSVKIASIDLDGPGSNVEVVHRWRHTPDRHADGSLRWDWSGIVREVTLGLRRARHLGRLASIGVDGWGVDYGLLDGSGRLIAPPFSYRDERTSGWDAIARRLGRREIYKATGIQMMSINTLFQLAVHDPLEMERAATLLPMPDLLVHHLTGRRGVERSIASTTAMVDLSSGTWSTELMSAIGVDPQLLPAIDAAGTLAGEWEGTPVVTVGAHDTASAFLGVTTAPDDGIVLVSTGTWVLVGQERSEPDLSDVAFSKNFSNEAGALGGVRFLKNVPGLWMLERCAAVWGVPNIEGLVAEAAALEESVRFASPHDIRFRAAADMEREVRDAAGLGSAASRAVVVRSILESIAFGVAEAVAELGGIVGVPAVGVTIVGGGTRIELLNRLIGRHTGLPVTVGSAEATALGNALVQGIAIGRFEGLADARAWLGDQSNRLQTKQQMV